jgi:hypothetical protein
MALSFLHEKSLQIGMSLSSLDKALSPEEMSSKFEWLRNTSLDGIELYLKEAVNRGYAQAVPDGPYFKYKGNKGRCNKDADEYFN